MRGQLSDTSDILLDVSRLLYRGVVSRFSGIDRVELAYAEELQKHAAGRLRFVASNYRGGITCLPTPSTLEFLSLVRDSWAFSADRPGRGHALRLLARSVLSLGHAPLADGARAATYLNVSGHPLSHPWTLRRFLASNRARFVPLVHDLIPIDHPEFVPASWTGYHHHRLEAARQHAAGVIVTSEAVAAGVRKLLPPSTPLVVAPLGVGERRLPALPASPEEHPYFVCLGTIEPRKNHLTLLHLWRRLALEHGERTPRLVIIGRRGWENEQVIDILDRCPVLRPHIQECNELTDEAVLELMHGARALLMPSFIEGYGLPVVEALAAGTPVICSAIAAHREVGKGVPDYLDPLDSHGWMRAITDYAEADSPRRAAQAVRLHNWEVPGWDRHFAITLQFLATLGRTNPVPAAATNEPILARTLADA